MCTHPRWPSEETVTPATGGTGYSAPLRNASPSGSNCRLYDPANAPPHKPHVHVAWSCHCQGPAAVRREMQSQ